MYPFITDLYGLFTLTETKTDKTCVELYGGINTAPRH